MSEEEKIEDEAVNPIDEEKKKEKKPIKTSEEKKENARNILVKVILWITMIGLFVAIIGGVWGIGDAFSTTKWESFAGLEIQTKLFVIALILLGIFFIILFLVVLYKRGINSLYQALFKEAPEQEGKETEEYVIAKIITAGMLISFFTIFVGLVIAFIQFLAGEDILDDPFGFWSFVFLDVCFFGLCI